MQSPHVMMTLSIVNIKLYQFLLVFLQRILINDSQTLLLEHFVHTKPITDQIDQLFIEFECQIVGIWI